MMTQTTFCVKVVVVVSPISLSLSLSRFSSVGVDSFLTKAVRPSVRPSSVARTPLHAMMRGPHKKSLKRERFGIKNDAVSNNSRRLKKSRFWLTNASESFLDKEDDDNNKALLLFFRPTPQQQQQQRRGGGERLLAVVERSNRIDDDLRSQRSVKVVRQCDVGV